MEIWVHAVYIIIASINALLICLGLQSSIRIIHLHARTHACSHAQPQNWCFAKKNTDLLTAREMKSWKRRGGEETWAGRTANNLRLLPCLCSASVLLQYWFAVLIIRFTYTQHKTMLNQQKYQLKTWKSSQDLFRLLLFFHTCLFLPAMLSGKIELCPDTRSNLTLCLFPFGFFLYLLSATINCACCVTHLSGLSLFITPPDGVISALSWHQY